MLQVCLPVPAGSVSYPLGGVPSFVSKREVDIYIQSLVLVFAPSKKWSGFRSMSGFLLVHLVGIRWSILLAKKS